MGGEVECGGNGQTSRPVVEKVGLSWNKMHRCQLMMGRWGKKSMGMDACTMHWFADIIPV